MNSSLLTQWFLGNFTDSRKYNGCSEMSMSNLQNLTLNKATGQREIKVADGIKFANQLMLNLKD